MAHFCVWNYNTWYRCKDENDDDVYGDCELFEGLTSNLLFLYNDGVLRSSASSNILHGYARAKTIDAAKRRDVHIVVKTDDSEKKNTVVTVGDGKKGGWMCLQRV